MITAKRKLKKFKIKITVFKPSGKCYTSETFEHVFTDCGSEGHPSCSMNDVADYVRLLNRPGFRRLPGLCDSDTQWDGPILIDCEDGYPMLILPEAMRVAGLSQGKWGE